MGHLSKVYHVSPGHVLCLPSQNLVKVLEGVEDKIFGPVLVNSWGLSATFRGWCIG